MIRKVIITLILIILLVSLFACGSKEIEGTVVGKDHTERYTTMMMIYNGRIYTMIPVVHPESWYLTIQKSDGKKKTISVSHETYDEYDTGDYIRITY